MRMKKLRDLITSIDRMGFLGLLLKGGEPFFFSAYNSLMPIKVINL